MRTSHAFAFTLAVALAGCGDKCPTETPQVSALPTSCTAGAGNPVSYPLRLCPTCNQTGITCDVDMSSVGAGSGTIFLDPKAEACETSGSCPPSCAAQETVCSFTAPGTVGTYKVSVFNPATGSTMEETLQVNVVGGSCTLASL